MQLLEGFSIKILVIKILLLHSISESSTIKILQGLDLLLNTKNLFSSSSIRSGKSYSANVNLLELLHTRLENPAQLRLLHKKYQKNFEKNAFEVQTISIFKKRLLDIATHNLLAKNGLHSYEKGVNQFTDMNCNSEELSQRYDFFKQNRSARTYAHHYYLQPTPWFPLFYANRDSEQTFLDWRNYGAVSFPKNQGRCGSCSFFATVAALESHNYLVKMAAGGGVSPTSASYTWGSPPDLSEQELLDCARNYSGYRGCNDNLPTTGLDYMLQNGLSFEWDYPYQDKIGSYCYAQWNQRKIKFDRYFPVVPSYDEERIKQVVRDFGPVIAGMHMSLDLKMYQRGIYDQQCTDPHGISHNIYRNHMVLIVGYGSQWLNNASVDYWIVKNSYGDNWGDGGYFRIVRNKRLCLLGEEAYYLYSGSPDELSL